MTTDARVTAFEIEGVVAVDQVHQARVTAFEIEGVVAVDQPHPARVTAFEIEVVCRPPRHIFVSYDTVMFSLPDTSNMAVSS